MYEPDSHYNIYSHRYTLKEYQELVKAQFEIFDVRLGELDVMITQGEWAAIRYDVFITNKETGEEMHAWTHEVVLFKDNPEPIGARVVEGWALSDLPLRPH